MKQGPFSPQFHEKINSIEKKKFSPESAMDQTAKVYGDSMGTWLRLDFSVYIQFDKTRNHIEKEVISGISMPSS